MNSYGFLVLSVIVLSVQGETLSKEKAEDLLHQQIEDCAKELNASKDDVDKLFKLKVPESDEGKCVVKCVYEKVGWMKNGTYDAKAKLDSFKKIHEKNTKLMENYTKMIEDCESSAKGGNECDIAKNVMDCEIKIAKENKWIQNPTEEENVK
ncbi:general odorant-binding protein 56d-like [Ctenocephalides felis]|uniref:general odorant-binding protein 56d-like n=1 Tax=Ctenocephalides felis TaxID=7515 RepID=UPI000E6E172A|nr:general odorant-binding protein 56d-like [Ctenocephalides felis]